MSALTQFTERLRAILFRGGQERDLADEMRFHIERESAERIRAGESREAAQRNALLAFGGVEQYKEAVRDARGVRPLQDLGADIRYALRGLRRNPGYTATAILVLGLGLGATTAVFSIVYSVVLAGLPYPAPDQLVMVTERNAPTNTWNISTADAAAIAEQQHSFEAWGAVSRTEAELAGTGNPERIRIGRASAGVFRALGVPAAAGRVIVPADEASDAAPVVVVSRILADRLPGGAASAIGRSLTIDGVTHEVVGVLPSGRDDLAGMHAAAWTALKLRAPVRRGPFWLRGIGRLKPGVSVADASRDLATISGRILPLWSDFRDSLAKLTPLPLRDVVVGNAGKQVGLFAGAVVLVLLLAITNVATLVLVRAGARDTELGVRMMLGAGRARIARLLLTENILLTLAAAGTGLLIAALALKLAVTMLPNLPRLHDATLDWRAVVFAITAAAVAGILVSISPIATLSARAAGSLRADARRTGSGRRTNLVRSALVMAEFALALPLLVGAGLLLNSFVRLQRVDPGFDPSGVVAAEISLPAARYPDAASVQRFWTLAEQRIAALPGVVGEGLTSNLPPDDGSGRNNFNLVDHLVPEGQVEPTSPWFNVSSSYFDALGVRLIDGRLITPADTVKPVVVVSRSWARHFFPNEQAVGRQMIEGGCYNCPRTTIIGVVADVKNFGPAGGAETIYGPVVGGDARSISVLVRSREAPAATLRAVRDVMRTLDPQLPIVESTLAERYDGALDDPRHWTSVLGAFAGAGAALAGLGIFGLMSYVVRQRRREIGVRLALGAQPASMARLIVGRGMRYAAVGSVIGLVVTMVLADRVQALLFGVAATDGVTIAGVLLFLLAVALVACWIPARRAARIRPLEAIGAD